MSEIEIRFAGAGDAASLAGMIDAMDRYYGDPERPAGQSKIAAEAWLRGDASDSRFVLAFAGEEPVGLAVFSILHPGNDLQGQMYLKDLYIDADWRGRRVGVRVMKFLAEFCRRQGIGRIDWSVENERSQFFYERLGAVTLPHKTYMRLDGEALAELAED